MRKLTLITAIALALSTSVFSQPFEKGTSVAGVGLGLVNSFTPGHKMLIPPVLGSYEIGITDLLGIGYISVGGQVGIGGSTVSYFNSTYNWFYISLLVRGAYHFDFYNITGAEIFKSLDIYAGVAAGPIIVIEDDPWANNSFSPLDAFVGARYYFSPDFGAFAEAGVGLAPVCIGLSFKL